MLALSSVGDGDILEAVIKLISMGMILGNISDFTIVNCSI
jgi:hypothetical protein